MVWVNACTGMAVGILRLRVLVMHGENKEETADGFPLVTG